MSTTTSTTTQAWEWTATGTTWRVLHTGGVGAALAAAISQAVERDEARWSRFRRDSEVSRLNRAGGRPVPLSPETLDLLEASIIWTRRTDGVFQPLIGGTLVAWGYRGSLLESAAYAPAGPAERQLHGCIDLSREAGAARIPPGSRLDLGGIAKSWIAARVAALVASRCDDPAVMVDAGGDLVAACGDHFVAVEDPTGAADPIAHVLVGVGQGVATSGYGRRQWRNGDGRLAHHLIDPATGAPGRLTHATVVSDDPVAADVLAKVLALRPDRITEMPEAATVIADGHVATTPRWEQVATR
jgi:thiamine biosynthesis lipoprotein